MSGRPMRLAWLEDLLGLPAVIVLAGLFWWQQKQLHLLAPGILLAADRALTLPGVPPLLVYAGLGAALAMILSLLKADRKLLGWPLRLRAVLLIPMLWLLFWWLKHDVLVKAATALTGLMHG